MYNLGEQSPFLRLDSASLEAGGEQALITKQGHRIPRAGRDPRRPLTQPPSQSRASWREHTQLR